MFRPVVTLYLASGVDALMQWAAWLRDHPKATKVQRQYATALVAELEKKKQRLERGQYACSGGWLKKKYREFFNTGGKLVEKAIRLKTGKPDLTQFDISKRGVDTKKDGPGAEIEWGG